MKTKVKICGIQTIETARAAVDAGADFLGFNFVSESKRYITPAKAKEIIDKVKGTVEIIGVFRDVAVETVNTISKELGLAYVQLHGDETPEYCQQIDKGVIKVFSLPLNFDSAEVVEKMKQYQVSYFMIDREKQGEGMMHDGEKLREMTKKFPLFVAGGLTSENIGYVVQSAKPFGVDVSSGVESNSIKDTEKIIAFIQNAKGVTI